MKTIMVAVASAAAVAAAAAAGMLPSFTQVDVSQADGTQAEVTIAADPTNPSVLLAASNSLAHATPCNFTRVYTSVDGGATWSSVPAPKPAPVQRVAQCSAGDPGTAIDAHGREYLSFLSIRHDFLHQRERDLVARLQVAARDGATGDWTARQVFPVRSWRFDDKPTIAVDTAAASPHVGRVYVSWTRLSDAGRSIAISHSDDGGVSWSHPAAVSAGPGDDPTFASLAIDAAGTVFVAWSELDRTLYAARSTDGEVFRQVAVTGPLPPLLARRADVHCSTEGAFGPPAQAVRCVTPTPQILVDSRTGQAEQLYLTYSAADAVQAAEDVFVAKLDPATLSVLATRTVHAADARRDEFEPSSALDDAGRLWTCYFDNAADISRRSVVYTCTLSADGGLTWAVPRAVASVPSDETKTLALDFQFGDYQGLAVTGGVAHPIWTDSRQLAVRGEEIYTTTLAAADFGLQSP